MSSNLAFRDAYPSEDDELARIMYNAFLPIWNHNWFQNLSSPLASIPSTSSPLSPLQARRLAFYRSWIALVRAHSGDVTLAYTPSASHPAPSDSSTATPFTESPSPIAAVTLLLPPHARPSWSEPLLAWRTGLLQSLFKLTGPTGIHRVSVVFEGNVHRMIAKGLTARGIADGKEERLLFCQGCVRNPDWEGRAPARKLLDWAVTRWWDRQREKGEKLVPIWLDTTIDDGERAYRAVGFELVGECMVETGADAKGITLGKEATAEEKEEGRRVAKQRVMIRVPPQEG